MKCYYDVLGVDRSADQGSIKKAYYKLSLKWHPDKNADNNAEATEMFKEIQKAYKVLSDIHERSWYDKNRERFMTMTFNSEEELYDLIHTAAFSGFGNDANGFYSVYTHIFNILGEREKEAARISGEYMGKVPSFGENDSTYEDIVCKFYNFWEGFKTRMSFHWKNKHEIDLSIPRDIRRAMEKENADERNAARKMYNKEIQTFVESVKSKDPRIKQRIAHLKDKAIENEKKAINMKHKAWERSRKQFDQAQPSKVYGGISVDELEETLRGLELEHGMLGGEQNSDSEDLHCVACNKYFRSMASFANHEKSKNHNKKLASLRSQMMQEDDELFREIMMEEEVVSEQDDIKSGIEEYDVNKEDNQSIDIVTGMVDDERQGCDEVEGRTMGTESELTTETHEVELHGTRGSDDGGEVDDEEDRKADKKRRRRPKAERDAMKERAEVKKVSTTTTTTSDNDAIVCEHCRSEFATRNKLFQHIKATGHASLKQGQPQSGAKGKSRKK